MRVCSAPSIAALLGALLLAGCSAVLEPALKVTLDVTPAQRALCVEVLLRDGDAVLDTQKLKRPAGTDRFVIGIVKGKTYPSTVTVQANALLSACDASVRRFNGTAQVSASFPKEGTGAASLTLDAPDSALDADRDGFVATAKGGADCDDANASINPAAAERCDVAGADDNCNGASRCDDARCASFSVCAAGRAVALVFVSPPTEVVLGACSPALRVELRDAAGAPAPTLADSALTLAADITSATFFSDAACTVSATSLPLPFGASGGQFFLKAAQRPQLTLTVGTQGFFATAALAVAPRPFASLAFTTPPRTVAAGACSQALTVSALDAAGQPTPVTAPVAISFSADEASVAFFSDSACAMALPQALATLPADSSDVTVFARATLSGAPTLTATGGGSSATQRLTVEPGAPAALVFTSAPQTLTALVCGAGDGTVQLKDSAGNDAIAPAAGLTLTPTAAGVGFFEGGGCSAPSPTLTIQPGEGSVTFRMRAAAPFANGTLTVSSTGLTPATQRVDAVAGAAAALTFTGLPTTLRAGDCSAAPVTLGVVDANGFATSVAAATGVVLASANTSLRFYSDACATQLAGGALALPPGATTATFFVRGTATGLAQAVTATATGLTAAQGALTVTAGLPAALAFVAVSPQRAANVCSGADGAFTLEARDSFGNPSPVAAATPVTLSAPNVSFFSDSACASAVASVTLPVGASQVGFFARSTQAKEHTLTAQAGFAPAVTANFSVVAGPVAALAFASPDKAATAGACVDFALERRDGFGNPAAPASTTVAALSATPGSNLTFFSDAGCATSVSAVTFAANTGAAGFFVKAAKVSPNGAPWVVTANAGPGALTDTRALSVAAGAPKLAVFTSVLPTDLPALECSAVAVAFQLEDGFGNVAVAPASGLSVALGGTPTDVAFSAVAACTPSVTSVTVAGGASTGSAFFVGQNAGLQTLTLTPSGGTATSASLTLLPALPKALLLSTPAPVVDSGACAQATLTRVDRLGRPSTAGGALAATASASPVGLSVFRDGACATAGGAVTVAPGASAATFSVRGAVSGTYGVDGTAPGLTAAPTLPLRVRPLVQSGACTLAVGQPAQPLEQVVCASNLDLGDVARTLLFFQAVGSSNNPSDANVGCSLTASPTPTLQCTRFGNGGAVRVQWQTLSFGNPFAAGGVSVEHVTQPICTLGLGTNPNLASVADSPLATRLLLFSSASSGGGNAANDFLTARYASSTSVEAAYPSALGTTCNNTLVGWYQTVRIAGANVLHGVATAGGTSGTVTATTGGTAAERTVLLHTSRQAQNDSSVDICARRLKGAASGATVSFTRGCAPSNRDIEAVAFQRVELPVGFTVSSYDVAFASGDVLPKSITVPAVDLTRTVAFIGGMGPGGQAGGQTDLATDDVLGAAQALVRLDTATTLTVERGASGSASSFTVYVVTAPATW